MSSLAVGHGLEGLELWLSGLFSAADLAAADLLLQLSVAKGIDDEAAESSSATTSPSPRSARPGCGSEDLTVDEADGEELEERVVEEPGCDCEDLPAEEEVERIVEEPAPVSTELDRRARKRYRQLSELYAATSPVSSASSASSATEKKKKRKRHHRDDGFGSSSSSESQSSEEATRYGGDY